MYKSLDGIDGRDECCYTCTHGPLARYVELRVAHAPGMTGTFSPPPRVSDPDMHHSTSVTHVPWCMSGSLTGGFLWMYGWENVPGIPGACATRNFTCLVRGPWFWAFWAIMTIMKDNICGLLTSPMKVPATHFAICYNKSGVQIPPRGPVM